MHNEALAIFNKRLEYYPEKLTSWNQLGITQLLLNNSKKAESNFNTILEKDSTNSRAHEYLRLLSRIE